MTQRSIEDTIHLADDLRKMAKENPPPGEVEESPSGKLAAAEAVLAAHDGIMVPFDLAKSIELTMTRSESRKSGDAQDLEQQRLRIATLERDRAEALARAEAAEAGVTAVRNVIFSFGCSPLLTPEGKEDIAATVKRRWREMRDRILQQSKDIRAVSVVPPPMKFDPATGEERPYPSDPKHWRAWHGPSAWLRNPWTGALRDARDVGSDPFGHVLSQLCEPGCPPEDTADLCTEVNMVELTLEHQVAKQKSDLDSIAHLLRGAGIEAQLGADGVEDVPASVHHGLKALGGRIESIENTRDDVYDLLPRAGTEREAVLHAIGEYCEEYTLPEAIAWRDRLLQGLAELDRASREAAR
jgi:hypothetical protein